MRNDLCKLTVLLSTACLLIYKEGINLKTIVVLLFGMIIGMLGDLPLIISSDEKNSYGIIPYSIYHKICGLCYGIFFLFGLYDTAFVYMSPFIIYDMARYKKYIALPVLGIPLVWYMYCGKDTMIVVILILTCISLELALLNKENLSLNRELLKQRDASVEHDMLAEQRNRELIEKQDTNIYMATLKERNRIAREIHDNVGHMLTRSILQVGAIKVVNQENTLKEPLEHLHETLNTAMTSMRNSVHDLHDESVDLQSSVEKLTKDLEGFRVELDYDMSKELPKDVKYAFIAITKEALNNAVKYSNGDKISVMMREHPGFYQLMIEDNGTDAKLSNNGIGLQNMRERVSSLGGSIQINAENGFRILVSLLK